MRIDPDENLLRTAFAPARGLEPTAAERSAVLSRAAGSRSRGISRTAISRAAVVPSRRVAVPAAAAAALLLGCLYAVPPTRAALEDAAETVAEAFSGYSRGRSADAPGRSLGRNEAAPEYFGDAYRGRPFARDPRVLAEAGGYKLFAYRAPSGALGFDLGDTGVGAGFGGPGEIGPGALYVLGPGSMRRPDRRGQVPLFGLAADSVARVELTYADGPPTQAAAAGGFVLLAEPGREPRQVVGFDARGREVESKSVAYIGWSDYLRPAG